MQGIWVGIQNWWATLLANIQAKIAALPEYIKKLIGYGSPAKMFIPIGESMAQGIGAGFTSGMKLVNPVIDTAMMHPQSAYATAGARQGGGGIQGGTYQFYSSLTMEERRRVRRDSREIAQRELLRSLR